MNDVRSASALHDQRRPAIDEPVPDRAGIVVALIARPEDRSANTFHEALYRLRVERHLSRQLACHRLPPLLRNGERLPGSCVRWPYPSAMRHASTEPECALARSLTMSRRMRAEADGPHDRMREGLRGAFGLADAES
jgi:hypothetical protein